mmetsp:Transcript_41818/g.137760  ORF Transcript_41818/g.137760 Transcript_41818/m.137760 type:complete len:122 (-) Transcript_41818:314-679(-)
MHKGVDGEVYNIGCDDEFTNLEVAKKLVQAVTPGISDEEVAAQITHVEDRAFNDVRYYIDSSKLQALGWKCQVSFEEGLKRCVDWYKAVDKNWWPIGTDSALAPHPVKPKDASPCEVIKGN